MGRKINPIGFRLAVRRDWRSRWFAKGRDFAELVVKDAEVRKYINKTYPQANISLIEIERMSGNLRAIVHAGRPGVLIGKKGEGIDAMRAKIGRITGVKDILVDVKEVSNPDADAKLIALNIASQLERRIMFRRAMRRAMAGAMRLGVEGVKIMCAGRLNGIEIARTEWYREGRLPLHTLKNDVDYGFARAETNMGAVGIKVWVSRGDGGIRKKPKYSAQTDSAENAPRPATAAAPTAATSNAATATPTSAPPPAAPPAPSAAATPPATTAPADAPMPPAVSPAEENDNKEGQGNDAAAG